MRWGGGEGRGVVGSWRGRWEGEMGAGGAKNR